MEERPETVTNSFLDQVVERLKLPSDYALAKVLKVSPQAVSKMRQGGGMSTITAIRVAELLGADQPFSVLASLVDEKTGHYEKTGHLDMWAAFRAYLKTVKMTLIGVVAISGVQIWNSAPAEAGSLHNPFRGPIQPGADQTTHIRQTRRRRGTGWRERAARTLSALARYLSPIPKLADQGAP